jgi:hypothetical protein
VLAAMQTAGSRVGLSRQKSRRADSYYLKNFLLFTPVPAR